MCGVGKLRFTKESFVVKESNLSMFFATKVAADSKQNSLSFPLSAESAI